MTVCRWLYYAHNLSTKTPCKIICCYCGNKCNESDMKIFWILQLNIIFIVNLHVDFSFKIFQPIIIISLHLKVWSIYTYICFVKLQVKALPIYTYIFLNIFFNIDFANYHQRTLKGLVNVFVDVLSNYK